MDAGAAQHSLEVLCKGQSATRQSEQVPRKCLIIRVCEPDHSLPTIANLSLVVHVKQFEGQLRDSIWGAQQGLKRAKFVQRDESGMEKGRLGCKSIGK